MNKSNATHFAIVDTTEDYETVEFFSSEFMDQEVRNPTTLERCNHQTKQKKQGICFHSKKQFLLF
jgi:tRNA U34 2-thiouridine synthase MnmA/TrmU